LFPLLDEGNIRIVCGKEHVHEIARHIQELGIRTDKKIIAEPCGRNTAPAIVLAMLHVLNHVKDAVLCIFPADHVIHDNDAFHENLLSAIKLAQMEYIVTFGIKPNYPETGYGYIESGDEITEYAFSVKRFVEKPDRETAKRYIEAGNFFWNSGMFTFKASVMMKELKVHQPELLKKMEQLDISGSMVSQKDYERLPNISIDYAVMEKTDKSAVLPSGFGWSDIGSWKSLYDFTPKDADGNVIDGDVISKNTKNCFITGYERLIATNKIKNMVVVETPDSVFVSDMESSRDVKSIVEELKQRGRSEYQKHKMSYSPWGTTTVLEMNNDCTLEKLILYPGSELETKTDLSTRKQLLVIRGMARTILHNQSRLLNKGESMMLSENQSVMVENVGNDPLNLIRITLINPKLD
ncbi:MAG: mannose-1-phosphate guanylyltransferase/mannose-6-phosphate isomerase, partial [Desulfobacterales bacterium]|jgi:mannose-1-phosphate guanylyltransferase/mannose-6-phosphate isomerase